jgi:hypothetical protein
MAKGFKGLLFQYEKIGKEIENLIEKMPIVSYDYTWNIFSTHLAGSSKLEE